MGFNSGFKGLILPHHRLLLVLTDRAIMKLLLPLPTLEAPYYYQHIDRFVAEFISALSYLYVMFASM